MKLLIKSFFIVSLFITFQKGFTQVGINTTSPLSTLDINGNLNVKEIGLANVNVAGSGLLNGGVPGSATPIIDGVYISLSPTAVGLDEFIIPDAVSVPGRIYILRNISNAINAKLYSFGGMFFAKDSNASTAAPLILPPNTLLKTIIIVSDGINWTYIF